MNNSEKTITDVDYADNLALFANTQDQAESLLYGLEQAAKGIGLYVNSNKTEFMCFNQYSGISLNSKLLKFGTNFYTSEAISYLLKNPAAPICLLSD